jgi:hypothetical protein
MAGHENKRGCLSETASYFFPQIKRILADLFIVHKTNLPIPIDLSTYQPEKSI